ncbi:MAG TPA: hypothetical protein ENN69_08955 [Spirochaetia bacterium]|nr:hypothetical protein [Spirochaetia bacterium]
MKKAVLLVAALLVCSSFAFAEVNIGAWGRGFFVVTGADEDIQAITMATWGPGNVRVGASFSGTSDNVGFQADVKFDGANVEINDVAKIWVKMFDMLTIQVGRIWDDTLRGNGAYGMWNWVRVQAGLAPRVMMDGEDLVFARIGFDPTSMLTNMDGKTVNFEVSLAPVEGLYIFAALGRDGTLPAGSLLLEDCFKNGQYGAGYTIADIGMIRAQYIGAGDDGLMQVAFKLTAVPGLTVDLGGTIPTDADVFGFDTKIGLYASYALDALTIHTADSIAMYDGDFAFGIGVGVDYNIGDGLALNADVRYLNDNRSGYEDGMFAGMIGITMGFSNGLIGIAFEGTTGYFADWNGAGSTTVVNKAEADAFAWAIPIRLEYWF